MHFHGTDTASIERRLAEIAEDERRDRNAFLRTLALLVFWPTVGVVVMGWGFQMDDPVWGPVIFLLAAVVADLGILGTMLSAYHRDA
jgi:hypothetical protein